MKRSDSIVKIVPALLKAQKLMGGATKGAANPYFKSKYADYGAVLEACKDLLNDNGIVILQPHTFHDGKNFVETTLVHESGEFITSETEVVCAKQNDPQTLGSAITYARRYGLQSLLSMPAEDDDGEKAMGRNAPAKESKPAVAKEAPASKPAQAAAAKTVEIPAAKPATKSSFKTNATTTPAAPKAEAKPAAASELDWN